MNLILGGGIAGLIISFYFKTFSILTRGKGQDAEYSGLKILKRTKAVDEFINRFINEKSYKPFKPKIYKVGFLVDNTVVTKVSETLKKDYLDNNWSVDNEFVDIEGYDMVKLYRELMNRFDIRTRKMFLNIKKINIKNRMLSGINPVHKQIQIAYFYNQLINTLPIPLFDSLIEGEFVKVVNAQMYICIIESNSLAKKMKDVDFVYCDKSVPYYRITKIAEKQFCVESERVFIPKVDLDYSCKVLKTIQIPFGRMIKGIEKSQIKNVTHIGRYATLQQNFTIDKLIEMLENKEVRL